MTNIANLEQPTDAVSRHAALEAVRDQVMASVSLPPEIRTIVQRHLTKALKGLWELSAVEPSPDVWEAMRQQGQAEGIAAAVQWLRDRSAMKPHGLYWQEALHLADGLEQSRRAMSADPPKVTVEEDRA